jgi:hypothetical protein
MSIVAVLESTGSCDGGVGVRVEAHVQGLASHSLYDYRVVAISETEVDGTGQTFRTQTAGGELTLPDGRVWELVSPPTKDGALITPIQEAGGLVQAAEGGSAITYLSVGPLKSGLDKGEPPLGNANETQVLSIRNAAGGYWSSQDLATPHEVSTGVSIGKGQEYRWFSPDLSVGLVRPFGSGMTGSNASGATPLSEGASEWTIYLRDDEPLSPDSSELSIYRDAERETIDSNDHQAGYLPLVTGCPLTGKCRTPRVEELDDVRSGAEFGGRIEFVGATTDLSHVMIFSSVPLTAKTPEGAPVEGEGLYEWFDGQLQLVSELPEEKGQADSEEAYFGNEGGRDARDAVSSNGSRIVWSYQKHLYMRNVSSEQTIQLDKEEPGISGGENPLGAQFQFASEDGSKVFFTDEQTLTADSGASENRPDLYECEIVEEVAGEPSCRLSDLSIAPSIHANVQGVVLSGSTNSSYLYFVARGVLTTAENARGEIAKAREDNLYMLHYNEEDKAWEAPVFVAILSSEDSHNWEGEEGDLETVTSRVSPNGAYLAFMSDKKLTGYNNTDVESGASDEEVYLYNALSDRLVCVSCNPSGERPAGVFDSSEARGGEGLLVDQQKLWSSGRWLAGSVPGWTAMSLETARYQSRYLADDGRVFFDSSDTLVPQATNGQMDVYEYEPVSIGSCGSVSSNFSAGSGGCVGLISSGASREESTFLDASGNGPGGEEAADVFFLTSAPLVSKDKDTAFDVYDAHVCSGLAPCEAEVVASPPCLTEASCKAAPSPQPSIYGAPASVTFSGAGNIAPLLRPVVKCSRGKRLKDGKCVKIKAKSKKKAKARKVSHDRRSER